MALDHGEIGVASAVVERGLTGFPSHQPRVEVAGVKSSSPGVGLQTRQAGPSSEMLNLHAPFTQTGEKRQRGQRGNATVFGNREGQAGAMLNHGVVPVAEAGEDGARKSSWGERGTQLLTKSIGRPPELCIRMDTETERLPRRGRVKS